MNKPWATRFAENTPMLMSADAADWLTSAMPQINEAMSKLDARMEGEPPVMAADDFWPEPGHWMNMYRPYNVQSGTLMIPVKGVLAHDFPYALGSWITGYEYLTRAFARGMADPEVARIAMVVNSPGGDVAGCFDAVDTVFNMRGTKPIWAFVNESAYSAAYAWASVADQIVMTRTSGVGSVGVVTAHRDVSKMMDEVGVKITFIYAGDHKVDGNPYSELDPKVRARMQKRIDSMYTLFISTTARNLGLPESTLRDTEALTYGAEEAVAKGLAHEIRSYDEALAAFSGELDKNAGVDDMQLTAEQESAVQARISEAQTAARAEGMKEGATAERSRIKAIMEHSEAEGRATLASHLALNTAQSVEEAGGILAATPKVAPAAAATGSAPGADFAQAMAKGNPEISPEAKAEDEGNGGEDIMALFHQATGFGAQK